MGQIVGLNAKCKRANLSALSSITDIPANGEYILVSSDNSMTSDGQGNFDSFIKGDGTNSADELELQYLDGGILSKLVDKRTNYNEASFNEGYIATNGSVSTSTTYYYTYPIFIDESETVYYKLGGTSFCYLSKAESGSDAGPYTPIKIGAAGEGIYTPAEAGWYVFSSSKAGFGYLYKVTPGVISSIEELDTILTEEKIVNNLTEGGTDKPLSAEQGKNLNEVVSILNQYTIPLVRSKISNNSGYRQESYSHASAIFENNHFTTLRVKDGYEYVLYAGNSAVYSSSVRMTTLVGSYTNEPFVNDSTLTYFWIDVKRADDSNIDVDEFNSIVILEYKDSEVNFKHENDISNYYKLGNKFLIKDFDVVTGEGWDINGSATTSSIYSRTDYIDVSTLDALQINCASTTDNTSYAYRVYCKWFDSNKEPVGHSNHFGARKDNKLIIGVPNHAVYVSIQIFSYNPKDVKIYGFKHVNSVTDSIYKNSQASAIAPLKKVSLIFYAGQSLLVGADALSISREESYFPLRMRGIYASTGVYGAFIPLVYANNNYSAESPIRGAGEMFVEAVQKENGISVWANEWEDHLLLFAGIAQGSTSIETLSNSTNIATMEEIITGTKSICDEFGYTMGAPAWVWMQGEQNQRGVEAAGSPAIMHTATEYKEALLAYHETYCTKLSTLAGITERPKCVIYQPSSQCLYTQNYGFSNDYLAFNNAYVELLRDNDEFVAAAPTYIFDGAESDSIPAGGNQNGGFIHLNARSYKTLGAYVGYAMKKAAIDGVKITGVIPKNITVDGTTISIKYSVPCPPLKFDTEWVKETPLVNGVHTYGFNVVKSDDTELISSVNVFDDTVTIECSESPIGAKLRYGLNGDVYHYPNSNYNGADGRIHGGRGNLRDSQGDYVQKEIRELGQTMRLDNWAYCFEELLTEPEGE